MSWRFFFGPLRHSSQLPHGCLHFYKYTQHHKYTQHPLHSSILRCPLGKTLFAVSSSFVDTGWREIVRPTLYHIRALQQVWQNELQIATRAYWMVCFHVNGWICFFCFFFIYFLSFNSFNSLGTKFRGGMFVKNGLPFAGKRCLRLECLLYLESIVFSSCSNDVHG